MTRLVLLLSLILPAACSTRSEPAPPGQDAATDVAEDASHDTGVVHGDGLPTICQVDPRTATGW